MDISMTEKELEEYLSQPIFARIATIGKNNLPNIHPVWFIYEHGTVMISTAKDAAKIRNIRRNPNIAILIDTVEEAPKGVVFRGQTELVEEDTLEITKRILLKYLTPDNPIYQQIIQIPRIIIKLRPEKTFSWDESKRSTDLIR